MNKLRIKILIALSFLFLIILFLGSIGSGFISRLSKDSREIILQNYASLGYTVNMVKALDLIYGMRTNPELNYNNKKDIQKRINEFTTNLALEENNITEAGEKEIVEALKNEYFRFQNLLNKHADQGQIYRTYLDMNDLLSDLYTINSRAIVLKNNKASHTAKEVSTYMMGISIFSLFVALVFILYFPSYLMKPIETLTTRIKAVELGDYNQKLSITSHNELGELASAFNSMAGKLKEYEEINFNKLLAEKNRLISIINSLPEGVIVLDEHKNIISVNQVVLQLIGMIQEEVIDQNAEQAAKKNDLLKNIFMDFRTNSSAGNYIEVFKDNKRSFYSKEIVETTTEDNQRSTRGYLIMLKNVTLFEERDTAKTNLLATASHELKTPLSSINLCIKLLEDARIGQLSDAQKKIVGTVRQEVQRLSRMVNELLDYSQAESGNIRLKIIQVQPEDIIDYALTSVMMLISEKKIQVETNIEPDLPHIKADVEKTVWVLVNLITNAVRFTPEMGTIKICCALTERSVKFSVIDQGPGIEKENMEKIFNKFVQIGNNPKGRGLGLAIAREFVNSQSGKLLVESEIGVGSNFSFEMPIA